MEHNGEIGKKCEFNQNGTYRSNQLSRDCSISGQYDEPRTKEEKVLRLEFPLNKHKTILKHLVDFVPFHRFFAGYANLWTKYGKLNTGWDHTQMQSNHKHFQRLKHQQIIKKRKCLYNPLLLVTNLYTNLSKAQKGRRSQY